MNNIKLGLLVFGEGFQSPAEILALAERADDLGFSRYWLGEHYVFNQLWCNPEMLLPLILGTTSNIRVGTAGILLPTHSPYRVASNFKLLSSLFPNRVDLGLAAGVPGNKKIEEDLTHGSGANPASYLAKLELLTTYLYEEEQLVQERIPVPPYRGDVPEVWGLGRSYNGLKNALTFETNFSRSLFHAGSSELYDKDTLIQFREEFENKYGYAPKVNIAFSGVCHETEEQARLVFQKSTYYNSSFIRSNIVGQSNQFYDLISAYHEDFGIDEFVFLNLAEDTIDKNIGISLLSEEFGLSMATEVGMYCL